MKKMIASVLILLSLSNLAQAQFKEPLWSFETQPIEPWGYGQPLESQINPVFKLPKMGTDSVFFPPDYQRLQNEFMKQFKEMDGTETGNGGFVRYCETKESRSVEFEDLVGLNIEEKNTNEDATQIINRKIELLTYLNPDLSLVMAQSFKHFQENNITAISSEQNAYPDYKIAGHLFRKRYSSRDCFFIQLYSRVSDSKEKNVKKYILLKPDLLSQLPPEHQAAAKLHELFYNVLAYSSTDLPYTTVFDGVVDLNQFVFRLPDNLEKLSDEDLAKYRAQLQIKLELYKINLM